MSTSWFFVGLTSLAAAAAIALLLHVASHPVLLGVPARLRLMRRAVCALNRIRYVSDEGVVFQRTLYSCGTACVQMVLGDRGIPLGRGLAGIGSERRGTSMSEMAQTLKEHGLATRGVRFAAARDLAALLRNDRDAQAVVVLESERLLPYHVVLRLGRWLLGLLRIPVGPYRHWAVVQDAEVSKILLRDPMFGLTELSTDRFERLWDGLTLMVGRKGPVLSSDEPRSVECARAVEAEDRRPDGIRSPARVMLERVSRVYEQNVLAVRQVSLELCPGEVFCLLGPNGAGKTTLLKMITGVLPPSSGRVILGGIDVWSASEPERAILRRSIGYMAERPFLYDKLTAQEYLTFIGELCGVQPGALLRERISNHLRGLRLEEKADTRIRGLSHGMRRKIAFIAAQLHEPGLLLLDEPTVGLDPASARLVKDRMAALRDAGCAVLMTTHVLEIAERVADRIGVLDHGALLFVGTLGELREMASSPRASLEDLFLRLTEPRAEGIPEADPASGRRNADG